MARFADAHRLPMASVFSPMLRHAVSMLLRCCHTLLRAFAAAASHAALRVIAAHASHYSRRFAFSCCHGIRLMPLIRGFRAAVASVTLRR